MDKTVIRILVMVGSLILFYLCVLLVASITQLATAADRIYLGLGQPVFWILLSIFLFFVVSPLILYFKLPKALIPPADTSGHKHEEYLIQLRLRLAKNVRLVGVPLKSQNDLQSALATLSQDANKLIRETAGAVFVSTAIMQNGRLDGFITLVTQTRMVWRIACIYQQRPSPRQMLYLYSNVGANALLAESIEDIDLSEIVSPILGSSLTSAIPGMSLIVNSIVNGAANAFLTLRVGAITRQYCEALSAPSKKLVRRNATLSAASMVGEIVKENGARVLDGSWGAVKGMIDSTMQGAKNAATVVAESSVSGVKVMGSALGSTVQGAKSVSSMVADSSVSGVKAVGGLFDSTVKGVKDVANKITSK